MSKRDLSMKNYDYDVEICIVGMGPAGLGAALELSKSHFASKTLILDAGAHIDDKFCSLLEKNGCTNNSNCNIISGVGGCSMVSGSKISIFPAGSNLKSIIGSEELAKNKLFEALTIFGNYVELKKPNIPDSYIHEAKRMFAQDGFDYRYYDSYIFNPSNLRGGYKTMLSQFDVSGISTLLNIKIIQIKSMKEEFELIGIKENRIIKIHSKYVILGVGRLGKDLLRNLDKELNLNGVANYMDVGVRLEFPIDVYSEIDKYHNDLKLLFINSRTYCVCKGGSVISYFIDGFHHSEGYFDYTNTTNFTNLSIMTRLKPSPDNEKIYNEIKMRSLKIGGGKLIYQNLVEYLNISPKNDFVLNNMSHSYSVREDITQCFPSSVSKEVKDAVQYFLFSLIPKESWDKIVVFAPEVANSGLSFTLNPDFSVLPGLYLIGECTGKFRGILQAFCSGIVCAESIVGDKL